MEKPKRGDYTFSAGLCRGILREEAYNKAMQDYRHYTIMQKYKTYKIYHLGKQIEEIKCLYKKDVYDYIRENLLDKNCVKLKLKDFKVESNTSIK